MTTFIRITNEKIYEKLEKIEQHIIITNGKVKLNRWISTTAMAIVVILITRGVVL